MEKIDKSIIQAKLFEFALFELVRHQRTCFQPLWTVDSWVKFLIWMTLNCGLPGDQASLGLFVEALGSQLSVRMRRLFFERILEDKFIHLMADPSDSQVIVLPLNVGELPRFDQVETALNKVGLFEKVHEDRNQWDVHDGIISIPWKSSENS